MGDTIKSTWKRENKRKLKVIVLTGTPCTGKTTLAMELSLLLHYKHIEVNELLKNIADKYDKLRDSFIISENKVSNILKSTIKSFEMEKNPPKGLIIDSHMAHFLRSDYADFCIVMKCELKALKSRLEARNYPPEKMRENLESEIFDTCLIEALENSYSKKYAVFFSQESPKSLAKKVVEKLPWIS